ncbi:MAG: hypothetical protein R3B68_06000 [Phycisphaerales bacterium]
MLGSMALAAATCLMPSCQTAQPEKPAPPAPLASSAKPTRVVPLADARDTDSNNRPDNLVLLVYLFRPEESAIPFWADGQFVFTLADARGSEMATWTFVRAQLPDHRTSDALGPAHSFVLNLKEALGTDDLPAQAAALSAQFIRTDGVTIASSGPLSIPLGPR